MTPKSAADGQWLCKPCHQIFSSWAALMQHKASKRNTEAKDHLHCKFCGLDFKTAIAEDIHVRQNHPQEQELDCPGCGHGPFPRVAALMAHIEGGECARISVSALDELREKKLEFPRRLQALTNEPIKNDYTKFVAPPQHTDTPSDWREAHVVEPYIMQENDFPALSTAVGTKAAHKQSSRATDENDKSKVWQGNGKLFSNAAPARPPTSQELKSATSPSERMLYEALDPDDPDHSGFNAARYYSEIIEQFLCPKTRCGKTFKKANGLIGHLRSPAHGGRTYRCPSCFKSFNSLTAIISHAESSTSRCIIRETDNYGAYLDQLTAGIVAVGERHQDGTPKYSTTDGARAAFGNKKVDKSVPPGW